MIKPFHFLPKWQHLWTACLLLAGQAFVWAAPVDQIFGDDALNLLTTAAGGGYSYDAAGNLLSITGPPPTKPSVPNPISGSTGAGRLPTLSWTAAQNAPGLTLYYITNSNLSEATQKALQCCLIQS